MGATYYCDVCKKETKVHQDLVRVRIEPRKKKDKPCRFDVCEKCLEKIMSPVKEFRTTMLVEFEEEGEG